MKNVSKHFLHYRFVDIDQKIDKNTGIFLCFLVDKRYYFIIGLFC